MRTLVLCSLFALGCAGERRFPLREPIWRDTDLRSVSIACHEEPSPKDPRHVSCAPRPSFLATAWDGADNSAFRPLSRALAVPVRRESVDVNALDEVPDSAWFTNRLGAGGMSAAEFATGACKPEQLLDGSAAPDGSWVVDKAKTEGSVPGFRVTIPGKGKFMLKIDPPGEGERSTAASAIGAAIHHAAGYFTTCEQVVWVRPSALRLTPGLRSKMSFGDWEDFDQAALDAILRSGAHRGALVRMQASAWLPGHLVGPFFYEGTRADDPNDVVPHEDRRELRALYVLDAWLGRYDSRAGNTLDTWLADDRKVPDSSPGHVVHYHLDTSECFGAVPHLDELDRRTDRSYWVDFGDAAADLVTLGIPTRSWDAARVVPGREAFNYWGVGDFVPDAFKPQYPNPAFAWMTERDAAWMARVLARVTPEMLRAVAARGDFTDPADARYLEATLEGRLARVLARWLTRLSPLADARVDGSLLCAVDLAARRAVPGAYRYSARVVDGAALAVTQRGSGEVCVALPAPAARGAPAYVRVSVENGVAHALVAHLWDVGSGFRLVGLERP